MRAWIRLAVDLRTVEILPDAHMLSQRWLGKIVIDSGQSQPALAALLSKRLQVNVVRSRLGLPLHAIRSFGNRRAREQDRIDLRQKDDHPKDFAGVRLDVD